MNMKLSEKEANLFFDLYTPLLDYTNERLKVGPSFETFWARGDNPNTQLLGLIANELWAHVDIIDDYLQYAPIGEEEKEIIREWKRFVRDEFFVERHLMTGTVFISNRAKKVYLVNGLYSTVKEMLPNASCPIAVVATLLPFKGKIITDGLLASYFMEIPDNVNELLHQIYQETKENNRIIKKL